MARLRKPTSSNRAASVDIRRQLLARIAELHATADGAFVAATQVARSDEACVDGVGLADAAAAQVAACRLQLPALSHRVL